MRSDLIEKRPEGCPRDIGGRRAVDAHKNLLRKVFGFLPITDKPIEKIQKRLLVAIQQPLKRRVVPGPDLLEKLSVWISDPETSVTLPPRRA